MAPPNLLWTGLVAVGLVAALPAIGKHENVQRELNGVSLTPALGYNGWNVFGASGSTAAHALAAGQAFISLGLADVGYEYINIDDCWSTMSRDSKGNLVADPTKWPNGIKNVTDQLHAMGLKFGLYGDSGTATCSGFPGSQGYEAQDAKQLAAWGVDYWKYDNCNTNSSQTSIPRYTLMSKALQSSGRDILYSICNWGADSVWTWGASIGNSWRVSSDISDSWNNIAGIAANAAALASYNQPGGFNDWDMLEVGNGGLTEAEERAHFGLWAISKSPLMLGCDFTKIPKSTLAIISNKGVIGISQDSLGQAAATFQPSGQSAPVANALYPYWAGKLSDGVVIGLVAANGAATLSVNFADVPGLGSGSYSWTELYGGTSGTGTSVSATLAPHDMVRQTGNLTTRIN